MPSSICSSSETDHGICIEPLTGAIGAEISGVDLRDPIPEDVFEVIDNALLNHLVIVFQDQDISPVQHKGFASRFSELQSHPFVESMNGVPEIIEIIKEPWEVENWGGDWHADVTFLPEPSKGAALFAKEVPPQGGDTLFSNMYLAYEMLSDGLKDLLDSLNAIHDSGELGRFSDEFDGMRAKNAERIASIHPVVRIHPSTQKKALFVNQGYTTQFEGMTPEESRPLLEYLFQHSVRPEVTCRVRWKKNTLVIWDNRVTLHSPVNDDFGARFDKAGFRRVMHRATFAGEATS
jgi:taurine dioxygenase